MTDPATSESPSVPPGLVIIERSRPSLLGRLITLAFLALAVIVGVLVFIPIAILALVLVFSFAIYLLLYRMVARPRPPGGEGRQNVRVIHRESDTP